MRVKYTEFFPMQTFVQIIARFSQVPNCRIDFRLRLNLDVHACLAFKAMKANEHVHSRVREKGRGETKFTELNEISQIHLIPYSQPKEIDIERDDVIFARRSTHPLTSRGSRSCERRDKSSIIDPIHSLPTPLLIRR